jgi:hypothetical protein
MFERELQFFIANQERLVKEYKGKTLVLRGEEVVGVYPDSLTAYLDAAKKYEPGTFMIQPCTEGSDAYTVTITSHEILGSVAA